MPKLDKSSNADDYTRAEHVSERAIFCFQTSYSRKMEETGLFSPLYFVPDFQKLSVKALAFATDTGVSTEKNAIFNIQQNCFFP